MKEITKENLVCDENCIQEIFSIIIPTLNEENYIGALLKRIHNFELNNFLIELIIVDNGSVDGTLSIVEKYPCQIFTLPGATISAMRNYGATKAQGKWLGFIDADCMPVRSWAVRAKYQLEQNFNCGVIGSYYSKTANPKWIEYLWCSMRQRIIGKVNFLPAGNMAVRKKDFLSIGGFPADMLTGEDYALCQAYLEKEYFIINDPSLKSIHYGNPQTLFDILKKEKWYGMSCKQHVIANLKAKVFWATCLFLFGSFFLLVTFFLQTCTDSNLVKWGSIGGAFSLLLPVLLYAVIATVRASKPFFIVGYVLIFFFYFLGRSLAILDVASTFFIRKTVKKLSSRP